MHVLGKVCTWLMVPLVIAGVVLAGQAVNVRNSWTQASDGLLEENAKRADEIAQKEAGLNDLRNERALLERSWGRFWTSNNVAITDPQQGIISTGIGTRQELLIPGQEELPTVYGFYTPQDGPGRYIGAFKVIDVRDDSSSMQLSKLARPNDVATWPRGEWRFWRSIPMEYSNRHDNLWNTLISTEEHYNHVDELKRQATALNERAQEQIEVRVGELQGGPKIPMGVKGLVEALAEEEKLRDEQLLAVDQLRREIHGAQERQQGLINESRKLMQELPKPYLDTAAKSDPVKN